MVRGICGRIFIWTVDYFCPDQYLNWGPLDLQSDSLPLCHQGCIIIIIIISGSSISIIIITIGKCLVYLI